jgi:hypothetical protein
MQIYNNLKCVDADFKDAIIDSEYLPNHLRKGKAKNVSPAVTNKKELRRKLMESKLHAGNINIELILSRSSLPD